MNIEATESSEQQERPTRQGVKASAGSGKTYGLTGCYLHSLLTGTPPSSLITATFTRKAAGEILSRLLSRMAEAASHEQAAAVLSTELNLPNINRASILSSLQDLCRQMHRVSISTIDGLFNRLLQAYALEMGHDRDVVIIDALSPEAVRLSHKAINRLLAEDETNEAEALLDVLQDSRLEARVASELYRVLPDLYREFLTVPASAWVTAPATGLMLAPQELNTAITALKDTALLENKRTSSAVHQLAMDAANGQWEKVLKNGVVKAITNELFTYYNVPLLQTTSDSVTPIMEHAKYSLVHRYNARSQAVLDLLARFHQKFVVEQTQARILFFSDVPRLLATMLPGDTAHELQFRLDLTPSHLLLDEFQDTDPVQFEILQWFIGQIEAKGPQYGLLYCVGDLKQSIYGWRGAAPEIFERLHHGVPDLKWKITSTSYRSSQVVLDVVNQFFAKLPASSLKDRSTAVANWWLHNYEPHQSARQLPGYVSIEQFMAEAEQAAERLDDGDDETESGSNGATVTAAARRIAEIVRDAPNASVGVLMRTNERVARMIFQLKELGVAASAEGKSLLTDDPAVLLLMSAVKLADHPGDTASAFHLSVSPLAYALNVKDVSGAFRGSRELRRRFVTEGYATTLLKLASLLSDVVDRRSARRLEQLILLADEFDRSKSVRPAEFLTLAETRLMEDPSTSMVRVMTIHAAKGLEFDIAILPELEKSIESRADCITVRDIDTLQVTSAMLYPTAAVRAICPGLQEIWEAQQTRDLREAFCLLYVAMTRPRHALHILLPAKVNKLSLAAFVIECLCPQLPETRNASAAKLFELGEPGWMHSAGNRPDITPVEQPPPPCPVVYTDWPRHLMRAERPSADKKYRAALADTLLGMDGRAESLRQGVAIHAMLCLVEWADMSLPEPGDVAAAVRRVLPDTQPVELERWKQQFTTAMQFKEIAELLRRPEMGAEEAVEVWRERQFLEMSEGRLLSGIFDRVVITYKQGAPMRADIIDYKTDEIPNSTAKARAVQRHTHQLEVYRTAAALMLGLAHTSVSARLAFTTTGEVVSL